MNEHHDYEIERPERKKKKKRIGLVLLENSDGKKKKKQLMYSNETYFLGQKSLSVQIHTRINS